MRWMITVPDFRPDNAQTGERRGLVVYGLVHAETPAIQVEEML